MIHGVDSLINIEDSGYMIHLKKNLSALPIRAVTMLKRKFCSLVVDCILIESHISCVGFFVICQYNMHLFFLVGIGI